MQRALLCDERRLRAVTGRRVEWAGQILNPGEYTRDEAGHWHGCTPNDYGCNLSAHDVIEHEDGTITVSPSILVSRGGRHDEQGNLIRDASFVELWHGYLERGVWRE